MPEGPLESHPQSPAESGLRDTDPSPRREATGTPSKTDSERYPGASEGYQAGGSSTPDSERYPGDTEGYQVDEEYPSPAELRPPDLVPNELMPDAALAAAATGTDGLEARRRDWQVNVRLDHERHAALRRAAEVYGTTPTALARMLINRGSTAILSAYRAEMTAMEWLDPEG